MSKKTIIILSSIFCAIQITLLVLILTIKGYANNVLSWCSVAISFLYSLVFLTKKLNTISTSIALLFSVISDVFLVLVSPQMQAVAMTTFSVTQLMLGFRLYLNTQNKKFKMWQLVLRALLIVIVLTITAVVLKDKTDYLSLISMFYYANLIFNVVLAFIQIKKNLLLPIGMLLFLCCDTLVGIGACAPYISLPSTNILYIMAHGSFNWIWLFYAPSQALIALSLLENNLKNKPKEQNFNNQQIEQN